jgi:RNA polymerase sigma-70 factor (ECF subfamily)
MRSDPTGDLTRLLRAHRAGDRAAFDELVGHVHGELKVMARQQLRRARGSAKGATLDTVGLINEAYLKLVEESDIDWQSRAHFYAVTARAMRFIVVDHARRASAGKRGSGETLLPFDEEIVGATAASPAEPELVLAVHAAIDQLESFNERLARIVECRFFAGMTDAELAQALGVTTRTVQRDWLRAKAWLQRALESPAPA